MGYPVMWAAIPLLVEKHVQGTAFGFATSTRFGTIAVCYLIVGALTRDEIGDRKYLEVQAFMLGLGAVVLAIYAYEWHIDVKYNDSVLRKVHDRKTQLEATTQGAGGDVSL